MRSVRARAARLRHDLGGEWFLDPIVLLTIMPPAIVASVADLAEPTVRGIVGWTSANLAGFAVCFAVAGGLILATRQRRRAGPLPIGVTVCAGGLLGALKVLGTAGAGSLLGLTLTGEGPIAGRIALSAVFGMVAVPALVLVRPTLARHRTEHRLVVAETLAGMLDPGPSVEREGAPSTAPASDDVCATMAVGAAARAEAATIIEDLRVQLTQVAPPHVPRLLTEAIEHRLRPLTHRLWADGQLRSSDLTIGGLVRATLWLPRYPVIVPTLAHGAVVTLFALNRVAPLRAITTGVVATVTLAVVLWLARWSRPRVARPSAGLAHRALVLIAAAAGMTLLRVPLAPEFVLSTTALAVFLLAWVGPLILISGMVATAVRDRQAVRAQLLGMLGPDWYAQLQRSHVDAAAARAIADRLHGDLQGELLAAAARIDRLGPDDVALAAELTRIDGLLGSALGVGPDPAWAPLAQRLDELRARWSGLLDVDIDLPTSHSPSDRAAELVVSIVSEALTNARRHGMARTAQVRIVDGSAVGAGLHIVVDDDGVGPRGSGPGIGSAHLDAVAPGAWSRVRRDVGGTRLEVRLAGAAIGPVRAPGSPVPLRAS